MNDLNKLQKRATFYEAVNENTEKKTNVSSLYIMVKGIEWVVRDGEV